MRGRGASGALPARLLLTAVAAGLLAVGAHVLGAAVLLLPAGLLLLLLAAGHWSVRRPGHLQRRLPSPRGVGVVGGVMLLVWCGSLVGLQRSVAHDREYWAQPRGPVGGLVYVSLGDSSAQGVGASRPDRGYVGLLADRLRRETGRPVRVINLSRSGARVSDVVSTQVPLLAALHADLVTVAVGANDVRDDDPGRFAEGVRQLSAGLPPGSVIADVPYFMHGRPEQAARRAAAVVRQTAAGRGLAVVDLHAALEREGWSAMFTQTAADWFHPDDRGYRVWASAFWPAVSAAASRVSPASSGPLSP